MEAHVIMSGHVSNFVCRALEKVVCSVWRFAVLQKKDADGTYRNATIFIDLKIVGGNIISE